MTVPIEYPCASQEFERFMLDAGDISWLTTTNMGYNMVQGLLQAFQRRISVRGASPFCQ